MDVIMENNKKQVEELEEAYIYIPTYLKCGRYSNVEEKDVGLAKKHNI